MEVEIIRALERIIIVLFSGLSIILGWYLFKIGVVSPQSGKLSAQGFSFTLQKVGPGIFFSLFGTVVLSIALVNGLTKTTDTTSGIKSSSPANDNHEVERKITSVMLANALQQSELERLILAINSLELINVDTSAPYSTHKKAIQQAVVRLQTYRDRLVTQKFGQENMIAYQQCKLTDNDPCEKDSSYKEVHKWLTDNLLLQDSS